LVKIWNEIIWGFKNELVKDLAVQGLFKLKVRKILRAIAVRKRR